LVELLQLVQTGLAVTAVTLTVAVAPMALLTGQPVPDITPLIETISDEIP